MKKFTPFYPDPDVSQNIANDKSTTNDSVNIEYNNPFSNKVDTKIQNSAQQIPDPVNRIPAEKVYNMVHQNDTMRQNSNVHVPSNIVENDLPAIEPVNPVVTNCELDQGKNEEINTPVVRRSSRSNKGINDKLKAEYELYNVNYCYGCKCKLGASATKTPTLCDFGGG